MSTSSLTPSADDARPAPPARSAPGTANALLRVHCVADSAGGLSFELDLPGEPADRAATLLLRRRGKPAEEVGLPLTPAEGTRLRASLPATMILPEGRWDAHLQLGGATVARLRPGLRDLRALLDRVPDPSAGWLGVRIPYPTKSGDLAVRAWHRAPHAEAGAVLVGARGLDVEGRLFAAGFGAQAHVECVHRAGEAEALRAEVRVEGTGFTARIEYGELAPGTWDLWLRPSGAQGPRIRIARLLDDIADRKPVFRYPVRRVDGAYGPVSAEPYYTVDNDLSVSVNRR
ncbi:hypothetical protein [Streptomyces sp. KLOTTS4A1]|uniref:hypothetical protein n=1 Tax=Streptomyces sp. KLOTTS4A1 TaxID=3390996 RepID=UPI0039F61856